MSRNNKSPLHPSALTLNDMNLGRRVIQFNKYGGIQTEAVIVSRPYVLTLSLKMLKITTKNIVVEVVTQDGRKNIWFLNDVGVIPDSNVDHWNPSGWNPENFVIDARKRALLPEPSEYLPSSTSSDFEDDWDGYMLDEYNRHADRRAALNSY